MAGSIVRVGDVQRVNTDTAGFQYATSVTTLTDDGWLVTWTALDQSFNYLGIYQQRYDKNGTEVGTETRVNTDTTNVDGQSVTALADGGWVVAWYSHVTRDIHQQRFGADGTKVGPETLVNTYTTYIQATPSVTALTDGGWVVTWASLDQDGSGSGIYQQRYDENGDTVGPETLVNTYTTDSQSNPSVAALSDGGWLVTWTSRVGTGHDASDEIHQQRFGTDGKAVGPETLVNTFEQGTQRYPSVTALKEGGWVVTWESVFERGIYQQRYDEDGVAVGPEIWVSPPSFNNPSQQNVTALADGGWLVAWRFTSEDFSFVRVYQQRYDKDGNPVGGDHQIDVDGTNSQSQPSVTGLPDGSWLVTWTSHSQGSDGDDIYQRRFTPVSAFGEGQEHGSGTQGEDLFQARAGGLTAGDRVNGGDGIDTLRMIEAGTLDLTAPDVFTGIEIVQGSGGNDIIVTNEERLSGITAFHAGGGTDALHLKAGNHDLSAVDISGVEAITLTSTGSLTFDDKATALLAHSQIQNGTVILTGASFTVGERTQLYNQGIRKVTDASGAYVLQQAQASLSKQAVTENAGPGTVIGTLSATDPTPAGGLRFELADNAGGRFAISGNQLVVANGALLDYESGTSHRVVVRIVDEGGIATDAAFTITLDDVPVETIKGTTRADRLTGGTGKDVLYGGLGKDTLTGNKGQDIFVFDTKPNTKSNLDKIVDFSVKDDGIWLDNKVFAKLGKKGTEANPAQMKKDFFTIGSKAKDTNDYIVYDKSKGVLYYDADGSEKGKAVEIATLSKKLGITYKDFFVI
jgi:hypothetical protein